MSHQWTLEQLRHLKDLEAQVSPAAKIVISKGGLRSEDYGVTAVWDAHTWDARLCREGAAEPCEVTAEELMNAGVPKEEAEQWTARTQRAVSALNRLSAGRMKSEDEIRERLKEIKQELKQLEPESMDSPWWLWSNGIDYIRLWGEVKALKWVLGE